MDAIANNQCLILAEPCIFWASRVAVAVKAWQPEMLAVFIWTVAGGLRKTPWAKAVGTAAQERSRSSRCWLFGTSIVANIYICQLLSRKVSAAVAVKFVFQSGCLLLQLPFLSGVLHCARTLFFTRVCLQRGGRVAVAFQMNYFFLILQRGVDPL